MTMPVSVQNDEQQVTMQQCNLIELCAQLSGFASASLTDSSFGRIRALVQAMKVFYPELSSASIDGIVDPLMSPANTLATVGIQDAVLLTLQQLAMVLARHTNQNALHEDLFALLQRVIRHNRPIIKVTKERQIALLQSCSMYLPLPNATTNDASNAVSEEARLHLLTCIQLVVQSPCSSDPSWKLALATPEPNLFVYLISGLLRIAEIEKSREVVMKALDTLGCVVDFMEFPQVLTQIVPGTSTSLLRFAKRHGHGAKATACAIACLARVFELALNDEFNQKTKANTKENISILDDLEKMRLYAANENNTNDQDHLPPQVSPLKNERFDDSGLDQTRKNVDLVLMQLFEAMATIDRVATSSWRVHAALVELSFTVVSKCRSTLCDSFVRCIEQLLVLSLDPIDKVASRSQQALAELDQAISREEWFELMPRLQDRFLMHLTELALKISTQRASWVIYSLKMLLGYLRVLNVRMQSFADFSIREIFLTLCDIVTFENVDVHVLVHRRLVRRSTASSLDQQEQSQSSQMVAQYRQCLVHFRDDQALELMMQLLHELGQVFSPAVYVDCAMELLQDEQKRSLHGEVLFILKELLLSQVEVSAKPEPSRRSGQVAMDVHVAGRLLEELLELDGWQHQRQHQLEHNSTKRPHQLELELHAHKSNWRIVMCLMLDCIAACAQLLEHQFEQFLLSTLYPVTEKLGAQDVAVEQSALVTLQTIGFFCEYPSVEALFERNMDYFVDALCRRLFHLETYPSTPFVIEGLLRHASVTALPLIDEVGSSLLQSIDLYGQTPHVGPLLRAMQHLITGINATGAPLLPQSEMPRRLEDKQQTKTRDSEQEESDDQHSIPMQLLLKDLAMLNEQETVPGERDQRDWREVEEDGEEEDACDDGPKDPEEVAEAALPVKVQPDDSNSKRDAVFEHLVMETLNRCRTFLAFEDPKACCQVMELVREGLVMLSRVDERVHTNDANGSDERKDVFLPAVHRLWPSLVNRFKRSEHRVIWQGSVSIVKLLSELCGDFVGERFVEDIWPCWRKLLEELHTQIKATRLTRSMLLLKRDGVEDHGGLDSLNLEESTTERKTKDVALLVQILECLTSLSRKSLALTSVVWEIAIICKRWLAHDAPPSLQEQTVRLFEALSILNADEVFCIVASLVAWKPPLPPRNSGLLAYDSSRLGKFYEAVVGRRSVHSPESFRSNGNKLLRLLLPGVGAV